MLACEDSMVKVSEDVLRGIGMKPARVCCGLHAGGPSEGRPHIEREVHGTPNDSKARALARSGGIRGLLLC